VKIFFYAVTIIFLLFTGKYSYTGTKVGTSAAQFLKIGIGARAIGMGGAFVAMSNDASALYWNPAGIVLLGRLNFTTTHTEWFAGLYHDFVGATVPFRGDAIGFSITSLNTDEIEVTTLEQPDGTGIYYNVSDVAINISYSRKLTDRFSVGVTGKFIQQKLYHESSKGFALDVGTILFTGFRGLRIGMCLSNFGTGMKLYGRDLIVPHDPGGDIAITPAKQAQMSTESWPLPTNFRVGIAVDIIGGGQSFFSTEAARLTLAIDVNRPTDNVERGNMGLEFAWNDRITARIGYKYNYNEQSLTSGGGYNFKFGRTNVVIDYAWASFGRLDHVHHFTLGFVL